LIPTHHTNEIAQNLACHHTQPAQYWIHTNMLTVNGQKMSKSLGNSFLPAELFAGNHPLLDKGYSAMTVRFFMLQAHYRSTLDFRNDALQAAEKGLERLMNGLQILAKLNPSQTSSFSVQEIIDKVYKAMNEDFNTPIALAHLFDATRYINLVNDGKEEISQSDLIELQNFMEKFVVDVLGLKPETANSTVLTDELMQVIIGIRTAAKGKKDFETSDFIRDQLKNIGIEIKDSKEGTTYKIG
jgi:cysteinyl-tRNA synthetase